MTLFILILNTKINVKYYEDIILTTLSNIEKDIEDTSDINMLASTVRMKEKADLLLQDLPRDNVVAVDNALKMLAADEQLSEMSIVNTDNTVIFSSKDDKRIETHDRDVPAAYRQAAEVMRQWYNLDNKKALPTFAVGNAFFQRKIHVSGIIAGLKQMVRH